MRGKIYSHGLHHITDTEKTTKTGSRKKLDRILVQAEDLLVSHLKETPDFNTAMEKIKSKQSELNLLKSR
jgi:hypothetical protein